MADTITTWTPISVPTDFQDDAVFNIDFKTKTVQVLVEQPIVAGENLSQFIKFQAPRFYDNIDLTEMMVNILYVSPAGNKGISAAVNTEYSEDMIRCGWLVPYAACPQKGTLHFVLEFVGADYTLKTTIASTPVLDSINDADVVLEPAEQAWYITLQTNVSATLQAAQTALGRIESIFNALSTPTAASEASEMLDESTIYVYTGSETGYTYGDWYYYDGEDWVSGGEYASTALYTDQTPTQGSTNAVSSGGVFTALEDKADKDSTPETVTPEETDADFYLSDSNGNVILELADGHIKTKKFDSSDINTETDTTLSVQGKPADAKAVGDAISVVEDNVQAVEESIPDVSGFADIKTTQETTADLFICDSQGNVIAELKDGHIRTKNFDSANIDVDSPIKEASLTDADLYICDSFGNVIGEFLNGHIRTKNFDSADMEGIPEDVSSLQTDVSALQTATSGIMHRVKDQTDGVYASCRWRQPTSSSKQFCMLIAGDIHTDPERMQNLVEYLNAVDAFDAGIMLGDMSGVTYDSPINHYADAIANVQKPFLTVIGNHDVEGGATSDADLWSKYGDLFQYADLASGEAVNGKCYYYKDFASYKIRVIVLMQYDLTFNGYLCFGQTQIDWLIGVLNSTPSDYGVIICEHTNPSRYMTYEMDTKYTSSTWKRSNYALTDMDGDPIPDIVNAWINGTTISQTYGYTFENPPADLSVSADFTSRGVGEFITYLGGHWHMNVLGHPTPYADQMDCHTPACGLSAARQGDMPRRAGTVSEDSFCAIGIDRDSKTVKIFQIGAHYTKDAVDRQYFQYSYGGA